MPRVPLSCPTVLAGTSQRVEDTRQEWVSCLVPDPGEKALLASPWGRGVLLAGPARPSLRTRCAERLYPGRDSEFCRMPFLHLPRPSRDFCPFSCSRDASRCSVCEIEPAVLVSLGINPTGSHRAALCLGAPREAVCDTCLGASVFRHREYRPPSSFLAVSSGFGSG